MSECRCGCGIQTAGGIFLPGHDAKLRAKIEESIGGLLNLERIIQMILDHENGKITPDQLSASILEMIKR